jgi:hypothetical protein
MQGVVTSQKMCFLPFARRSGRAKKLFYMFDKMIKNGTAFEFLKTH